MGDVVGDLNDWEVRKEENWEMYGDDGRGWWWMSVRNVDVKKEYGLEYYVGRRNGERMGVGEGYWEKIVDGDNEWYIWCWSYGDKKSYGEGGKGMVWVLKIEEDK